MILSLLIGCADGTAPQVDTEETPLDPQGCVLPAVETSAHGLAGSGRVTARASLQDHASLEGKRPLWVVEQARRDGAIRNQADEDRIYARAQAEWRRLIRALHRMHEVCFEDLDVEIEGREPERLGAEVRGDAQLLRQLADRGVYEVLDAREYVEDPG